MTELVTIQDVFEALKRIEEKMLTREDVEALIDTVKILNNPKTMEALHKSDQDIEAWRKDRCFYMSRLYEDVREELS